MERIYIFFIVMISAPIALFAVSWFRSQRAIVEETRRNREETRIMMESVREMQIQAQIGETWANSPSLDQIPFDTHMMCSTAAPFPTTGEAGSSYVGRYGHISLICKECNILISPTDYGDIGHAYFRDASDPLGLVTCRLCHERLNAPVEKEPPKKKNLYSRKLRIRRR